MKNIEKQLDKDILSYLRLSGTIGFALCATSTYAAVHGNKQKQAPNIVVILADDLGYGDLSCNGATKISTPVLDKISGEGVNFKNAYTASSMSSPSRYSIMTGRYSWRSRLKKGVLPFFDKPLIEPGRKTLGSMLKENGYHTTYVGKWHLGFNWALKANAPADPDKDVFDNWTNTAQNYIDFSKPVKGGPIERGFDYFYGTAASNNMQPYVYIENDRVLQAPTEDQIPYDHYVNAQKAPNWNISTVNEELTYKAVEVINNHFASKTKKPLFLYFAASAIHRPCLPTFTKGKSKAGLRGDMVVELDWSVDKVVKALKKNKAYNNTLFIFTSDNGPRPGDPAVWIDRYKNQKEYQGLYQDYFSEYSPEYIDPDGGIVTKFGWLTYGHKSSGEYLGFKCDAWDGGFRVPFIVRWPDNIKPHSINNNEICASDIMSTCADVLGIKLKDTEAEDSYSFLPNLLNNNTPQVRKSFTITCGGCGAFVVIKDGYKYIESAQEPAPFLKEETVYPQGPSYYDNQLYNISTDKSEQHNLYTMEPKKAEELKQLAEYVKLHGKSEKR